MGGGKGLADEARCIVGPAHGCDAATLKPTPRCPDQTQRPRVLSGAGQSRRDDLPSDDVAIQLAVAAGTHRTALITPAAPSVAAALAVHLLAGAATRPSRRKSSCLLVRPAGIEPATPAFGGRGSWISLELSHL